MNSAVTASSAQRDLKRHPAAKMLRFRFPGAIVFMIVAFRSSSVEHRTEILGLLFAYVVALLILAFAAQKSVEQRFIRLLASILDVAAISGLAPSLDLGAWV